MTYTVYGLIDPRTSAIFYIGCSANLYQRLRDHRSDRGVKVKMCTFKEFDDKIEAKRLEREIILSFPGHLKNSQNPVGMLSQLLYPIYAQETR